MYVIHFMCPLTQDCTFFKQHALHKLLLNKAHRIVLLGNQPNFYTCFSICTFSAFMYKYLPHSVYNRSDGFSKLVSIGGNEHQKSKLTFNITFFAMFIPLTSKRRNGNTFHPNEIDFGFMASHTVREYISVVLSNQVCGHLSHQSQKTYTHPYPSSHLTPYRRCWTTL